MKLMMISQNFHLLNLLKLQKSDFTICGPFSKCVMKSTNVSATFHESCDAKAPHLQAISNENTGAPNGKAIEPRHGVCGA